MARSGLSTATLEVVEQAHIDSGVNHEQVALCDAHDLIAIVNASSLSDSAVTVYRLKGEVAFTVALRDDEDLRPRSLQWKPDGSLLAVTWSDEVCCLYSGENGKLLYELPARRAVAGDDISWTTDINTQDLPAGGSDEEDADSGTPNIAAPIIWTSHDDSQGKPDRRPNDNDDTTTDNFFDQLNGSLTNGAPSPEQPVSAIADLVNTLTTMDTTTVFPRLSKIETPSGMRYSPEGNKFSTQASTDAIFDTSTFAPGIFSTLLTSNSRGRLTVFVDETIKVGNIRLSSEEQLRSASCMGCSSQVILARRPDKPEHHHLNFIDLPLERLGSPLNYVVSLNTRRLQSLMAYIAHTIRCVHQDLQTGIKGVPARLMKLLEEDLHSASAEPSDSIDTATIELQHLALTSNFHPVVLEWLKDIVKETGHKRWDQAVNAMYEHIQAYIFKNLLPALQRFAAAVSALWGRARFHKFAVELDFDNLLGWADALELVAQRTLRVVSEEHAQFKAFSKWLRIMIDVAVAGPGSKSADETEERESPNVDMDLCLRYIRGPLKNSLLKVFVESSSIGPGRLSKDDFFGHPVFRALSPQATITTLMASEHAGQQSLQPRSKGDIEALSADPVNLPLLACMLKAHTRLAIEEINAWQSQAVPRAPDTLPLDDAIETVWDMAVYPPERTASDAREVVHILASSPPSTSSSPTPNLSLIRIARATAQSRAAANVHTTHLPVPLSPHRHPTTTSSATESTIQHAALLDAHAALVLLRTSARDDAASTTYTLLHFPLPSPTPSTSPRQQKPRVLHTWLTSSQQSTAPSFLPTPTSFALLRRPGKRVVVVFSPAGAGGSSARETRWEVLDLEGVGLNGEPRGWQEGNGDEDVEME